MVVVTGGDRTAMLFDNFFDDGQTQTRTTGFGGFIRFKNMIHNIRIKAMAVVFYGEHQGVVGAPGADGDNQFIIIGAFLGIFNQIGQQLFDASSVQQKLRLRFGEVQFKLNVRL